MVYLLRPGQAERLCSFVEAGGTLVATYQTRIVDASTLCFLGAVPGPLRKLLGVWVEESDALPTGQTRDIVAEPEVGNGLSGTYEARHYFDLIHCETAHPLATYAEDFYAGRPAATVNAFGRGRAYYLASRNEERFHNDIYGFLARDLMLPRSQQAELPMDVTAHTRVSRSQKVRFPFQFFKSTRYGDSRLRQLRRSRNRRASQMKFAAFSIRFPNSDYRLRFASEFFNPHFSKPGIPERYWPRKTLLGAIPKC